jgi:hypothetical protein
MHEPMGLLLTPLMLARLSFGAAKCSMQYSVPGIVRNTHI